MKKYAEQVHVTLDYCHTELKGSDWDKPLSVFAGGITPHELQAMRIDLQATVCALEVAREKLNNIGRNVYYGMADDIGYAERAPNWQYIKNESDQALQLINQTLGKAGL
jgi:hypothetical protein